MSIPQPFDVAQGKPFDVAQGKKLIFDIETVGVDFETLDKISQDYIKKYAESDEDLSEAKDRLSFSPLTGEIIAVGVLNPETNKGAIYLKTSDKLPEEIEKGIGLSGGTEKEILEKFWETAAHYTQFITFNGRTFDAPYILIRSAILDVKPTKNLMANRYLANQPWSAVHIDLLDQLIFYGAVRKKFNLHFWSKAFGITSPKEEGITGDDIGRLYKEKKILEIAKYNLGDLLATKALYEKWQKYLSF